MSIPRPAPRRSRRPLFAAAALALAPGASAFAAGAPATLTAELAHAAPGLDPHVLDLAARALSCAAPARVPATLSVIDYSLPSTRPRLWVFDTATRKLLFNELVAHGSGSGDNLAARFSNRDGSHMSSLGAFLTRETYTGSNGYSLRLDGLEPGWNDAARPRAIVIHGAPYVSADLARAQGRIGRSWGCPAVRTAIAKPLIDSIRGGGFVFAYYPDADWLRRSRLLQPGCGAGLAAN